MQTDRSIYIGFSLSSLREDSLVPPIHTWILYKSDNSLKSVHTGCSASSLMSSCIPNSWQSEVALRVLILLKSKTWKLSTIQSKAWQSIIACALMLFQNSWQQCLQILVRVQHIHITGKQARNRATKHLFILLLSVSVLKQCQDNDPEKLDCHSGPSRWDC